MKQTERIIKTKNIGIVGLGLIGASIAKRLMFEDKTLNIVGVDNNPATIEYAIKNGIIHLGFDSLAPLKGCEVVFIAVPIAKTAETIARVFECTGDSALITDVAGVKKTIFNSLPNGIRFVGGHPMAGSEHKGIEASYAHLFESAYYILTPHGEGLQVRKDMRTMDELVCRLGAFPVVLSVQAHDRAVAKISHLPHALAFSLVNYAIDAESEQLAASGFRDLTRIASSGAELWTSAFSLNKEQMLLALDGLIAEIGSLRQEIVDCDDEAVTKRIEKANKLRAGLNILKGETSRIEVDVENKAGSIARIAKMLAARHINIKNIRILTVREGAGALSLELNSEADALEAKELLLKKGYKVF